jgi:hypothetical protein
MIRNLTRQTVLARRPRAACSLGWRLRGMLARPFVGFDALLFPRCAAVHSLGMHMPLDLLFLDRDGRVLGVRAPLRPWRIAVLPGAHAVLELPAGAIAAAATQPGDLLVLEDLEQV